MRTGTHAVRDQIHFLRVRKHMIPIEKTTIATLGGADNKKGKKELFSETAETKNIPLVIVEDPVFKKYGPPFLTSGKTKVVLNDRAVAVKCATMHLVKYDVASKSYERYDARRGLWVAVHEVAVTRLVDDLLLELGKAYGHLPVVARITAAKLSSLAKM